MGIRVCIDVGGTFTDLAVVNEQDGKLRIFKTSTAPENYTEGVLEGLHLAADYYRLPVTEFMNQCSSKQGGAVVYGTTIGTNALIQKKVGKVGLLCTKGHRDILTFREGGKEDPFDWQVDYPDPYIPRYLTLPVTERVDAQGKIITPLDEAEVREAIKLFKKYDVQVVAVAFLWAIENQIHENRAAELIEELWPGCPYVLSHMVNPILREYRRTISTVINASLLPVVGPYIKEFNEELKKMGYEGNLSLISSFGGVMSVKDMYEKPIYCVDSGPTGAPVAGLLFAKEDLQEENVAVCDMGGTSFDVSRVTKGNIRSTTEAKIGIDFLGIRKVDTSSIGAGGGSIAWVDLGGLLRVGPESAGSVPGPACYQRGGTRPTVTDANIVLGYLNPERILGGRMNLTKEPAFQAIKEQIARPLKIDTMKAAFSIWSTVCVNMNDAIRRITSWEGIDPREYVFVAGGGAAGLHIISMMMDMGVTKLVIPRQAGALSAVGGLAADMVAEFQRSYEWNSSNPDSSGVNQVLCMLEEEAVSFLESNAVPVEKRELQFSVDARYHSQPWDLTIPLKAGTLGDKSDVMELVRTFHETHESVRGSREEGEFIACSTWRVKAVGRKRTLELREVDFGGDTPSETALLGKRDAYFKGLGGVVETPVYNGHALKTGNFIGSPSIIEHTETTLVVFPGSSISVSKLGNYIVHMDE